jgi:hypothetical protein
MGAPSLRSSFAVRIYVTGVLWNRSERPLQLRSVCHAADIGGQMIANTIVVMLTLLIVVRFLEKYRH